MASESRRPLPIHPRTECAFRPNLVPAEGNQVRAAAVPVVAPTFSLVIEMSAVPEHPVTVSRSLYRRWMPIVAAIPLPDGYER